MEIHNSMKDTLKRLRLSPILHTLQDRIAYARKSKLSHQEFLELVLQDEIDRREHKSLQLRIDKAGFTEERLDRYRERFGKFGASLAQLPAGSPYHRATYNSFWAALRDLIKSSREACESPPIGSDLWYAQQREELRPVLAKDLHGTERPSKALHLVIVEVVRR